MRSSLLVFLLFFVTATAFAADTWRVGIDLDPGGAGGCDFDLMGVESNATDMDLLLELSVDPGPVPTVIDSKLHTCNPGLNLFEAPISAGPAPWPVGEVVVPVPGAVGHVIEAIVPESFLVGASQVRLVVLAEGDGGSLDVLSTVDGTPSGAPIIVSLAPSVPLLTPIGLGLLITLLLTLGWVVSRRWGHAAGFVLILGFIASVPIVAYALVINLDGLVGDWGATSPVASDSNSDSSPPALEAEILALYATQGGGQVSLRVDALAPDPSCPGGLDETLMGQVLAINFTPGLLVDQLLVEVADAWLTDPAISLDIEITGINGGFELHGEDVIDVIDTNAFSTDGCVAQTVVDWTMDTITQNVNEVYTTCVQPIRNGTELIGPVKCGTHGPY